jgi:hypothetical protein
MNVDAVAIRVRAEFDEMPGMALTLPQASRLFGLEHTDCQTVVEHLVDVAYLRRTRSGSFIRVER